MSQLGTPAVIGKKLIVPKQRHEAAAAVPVTAHTSQRLGPVAVKAVTGQAVNVPTLPAYVPQAKSVGQRLVDALHAHSILVFAMLLLLIGASGTIVYGNYRSAAITAQAKPFISVKTNAPDITGLNMTVPTKQLDASLQKVLNQSATLTVGDKVSSISPDTIKSWLQLTTGVDKSQTGVHISAAKIAKSVTEAASKYEKTAVNQVVATYADGSTAIIAPGKNGARLSDPETINTQAAEIAKTLLDAKGLAFTTPLETVPFQSVTPAAYAKLIEVNVVTKQMYLYDNGVLTHSYPISAGAPETPTPIGQYKIFSKLPLQDMKGFNADGTKYLQPHVHWISYFLPGGYAVHGNYWRPLSWFGNINSSHGCVSLPDDQAKEVYDWAPLGTTVITHY